MAQVSLNGQRPRELEIRFDPHRAAALGVRISEIRDTVARSNDVSGGFADVGRRQYTVRVAGRLEPEEFGQLVVAWRDDAPIYLHDVATVSRRLSDRFGFTLRNGLPAYYITVGRQYGANTVELLDAVNVLIAELNAGPLVAEQLHLEMSLDASVHIRRAIAFVQGNLALGALLAITMLWFFLRRWPETWIIAGVIPLSVVSAIIALDLAGLSLNVISLAGLAFAVGLVLDAAIVVQENIVRLRQEGMAVHEAAVAGAQQVVPALLASTITSVAVFLPILMMEGVSGQLFFDLAVTLTVAVVASLVIAPTVIPAVSARFGSGPVANVDPLGSRWTRVTAGAMALTDGAGRRAAWIIGLLSLGLAATAIGLPKADLLPDARADSFFVNFVMPPGGSIDTLEREVAGEVIRRFDPYMCGEKQPAFRYYNFFTFGPTFSGMALYPRDPRDMDEAMSLLRDELLVGIPDTRAFVVRGTLLNVNAGAGRRISLDLQGSDMRVLMAGADKAQAWISEALPGAFPRPVPGLDLAEPELRVIPDDFRITQVGLDRAEFANAVRALTGGLWDGEYFDGNRRVDMILRGAPWANPEALAETPLATPLGGIRTVGELGQVIRTVEPSNLLRVAGARTVSLEFEPPAGITIEEAVDIRGARSSRVCGRNCPPMCPFITAAAPMNWRGPSVRCCRIFGLRC